MKKIIAVLLSVVMLANITTVSFAQVLVTQGNNKTAEEPSFPGPKIISADEEITVEDMLSGTKVIIAPRKTTKDLYDELHKEIKKSGWAKEDAKKLKKLYKEYADRSGSLSEEEDTALKLKAYLEVMKDRKGELMQRTDLNTAQKQYFLNAYNEDLATFMDGKKLKSSTTVWRVLRIIGGGVVTLAGVSLLFGSLIVAAGYGTDEAITIGGLMCGASFAVCALGGTIIENSIGADDPRTRSVFHGKELDEKMKMLKDNPLLFNGPANQGTIGHLEEVFQKYPYMKQYMKDFTTVVRITNKYKGNVPVGKALIAKLEGKDKISNSELFSILAAEYSSYDNKMLALGKSGVNNDRNIAYNDENKIDLSPVALNENTQRDFNNLKAELQKQYL